MEKYEKPSLEAIEIAGDVVTASGASGVSEGCGVDVGSNVGIGSCSPDCPTNCPQFDDQR